MAAGEEFVNSSTPVNAPTEVAGGPETEAHQIAERIENEEIEPARVADHNTSDNNRQSKARRQAPGEEGKTPPGMIKTGKCSPGQQTIRHREGERSAEVPLGPLEARGYHPARLVLHGRDKTDIEDDVVDNVVTQDHRLAELVRFISKDEVVGMEIGRNTKATHSANGLATERHGGAKHELHAFHGAGDKDAGCHFDAHAHGIEPRPEAAMDGHSAIKTGDGADLGIGKG